MHLEQLSICSSVMLFIFKSYELSANGLSPETNMALSNIASTSNPSGFSSVEIKELLALFIVTKKVCCVEFTEVNPLLDNKGNKMAETAFEILDQLVVDLMRS